MEHNTTVQSKIELIEEEIETKYRDEFQARENRLDFSKPGWTAEMKQIGIEYRAKIEPELNFIRQVIVEALTTNEYQNRDEIASLLNQTKRLKSHILPSVEELAVHKNLPMTLSLFVLQDLQPDARNAMLYFADVIKFCKVNKIDSLPVLEQLLPYTSTEIRFGEYSMRVLFQQAIDQSTPIRKQKK